MGARGMARSTHPSSLRMLRRTMLLGPRDHAAFRTLAKSLIAEQMLQRVPSELQELLPLCHDPSETCTRLQAALMSQGEYSAARDCNEVLLQNQPGNAIAIANLAHIDIAFGNLARAIERLKEVVLNEPANPYFAHCFVRAIMQTGDYGEARREFIRRRHLFAPAIRTSSPWKGQSVKNRTVLVHTHDPSGDVGYGDVIQAIRFLDVLKQEGAQIHVVCPPPLLALIRTSRAVDSTSESAERLPRRHYECALDDVCIYRPQAASPLGGCIPYFTPPRSSVEYWRVQVDKDAHRKLRVGIAWSGSAKHQDDAFRRRSMQISDFNAISEHENIQLFSLHKVAGERCPARIVQLGDRCPNFLELAAAISALDVVVSIDTSIAHLSGAIGKQTCILLPYAPDWRWQLGRRDTPWYPAARLFRQQRPGDWAPVVEDVLSYLQVE